MVSESFLEIANNTFKALKNYGIVYVVFGIRNRIIHLIYPLFIKSTKSKFKFRKIKLNYCFAKYDSCWATERTIEIPLVVYFLNKLNAKNKRLLEIGNVLNNYTTKYHQNVVDKYEFAKEIINQDIVSYRPIKKYPLAVSISTLEHVGFDETPKNASKIIKSIQNILTHCLIRGGTLIFTIPIGYNLRSDKLIKQNKIKMNEQYFFKRISLNNKWIETNKNDAFLTKYNFPYENGNAILIGIIQN